MVYPGVCSELEGYTFLLADGRVVRFAEVDQLY